jgi:enoyl-CoA hydratase
VSVDGNPALVSERRGAVVVGTLNAPPLNPIGPELHGEIHRFLKAADEDETVRVIVLTGSGERAFSAGGDIGWMRSDFDKPQRPHWSLGLAPVKSILQTVLNLSKPFITRVNGHAFGLGATLAVLSDISIMVEDAKIADTHVKLGLAAGDGGALLWPLLMGFANARRYLLTGDTLTGAMAAQLGLITQSVPRALLDQTVFELADRLAKGAGCAINNTKIAINLVLRNMVDPLIEAHYGLEAMSALSLDHREAVNAFLERRDPKFTGQ